jgi:hypothetical protein
VVEMDGRRVARVKIQQMLPLTDGRGTTETPANVAAPADGTKHDTSAATRTR